MCIVGFSIWSCFLPFRLEFGGFGVSGLFFVVGDLRLVLLEAFGLA